VGETPGELRRFFWTSHFARRKVKSMKKERLHSTMRSHLQMREQSRMSAKSRGFGIHMLTILFTTLVFVSQGCASEPSARLYVDFSGISQEQKEFAVIARPEVRTDLHLTSEQLTKIAAFKHTPIKEIPAITNMAARSEGAAESDRRKIVEEKLRLYDQYLLTSLSNVLTAPQAQRLREIIWQVDGLKSLQKDHLLVSDLGLSDDQVGQVRDVSLFYEPILNPLYRRLGRQMVAGLSADESLKDRTEQVQSLSDAITIIEKERDRDLYAILTVAQREKWRSLVGRPLQIQWPVEVVHE
jgi:hypothetical protein